MADYHDLDHQKYMEDTLNLIDFGKSSPSAYISFRPRIHTISEILDLPPPACVHDEVESTDLLADFIYEPKPICNADADAHPDLGLAPYWNHISSFHSRLTIEDNSVEFLISEGQNYRALPNFKTYLKSIGLSDEAAESIYNSPSERHKLLGFWREKSEYTHNGPAILSDLETYNKTLDWMEKEDEKMEAEERNRRLLRKSDGMIQENEESPPISEFEDNNELLDHEDYYDGKSESIESLPIIYRTKTVPKGLVKNHDFFDKQNHSYNFCGTTNWMIHLSFESESDHLNSSTGIHTQNAGPGDNPTSESEPEQPKVNLEIKSKPLWKVFVPDFILGWFGAKHPQEPKVMKEKEIRTPEEPQKGLIQVNEVGGGDILKNSSPEPNAKTIKKIETPIVKPRRSFRGIFRGKNSPNNRVGDIPENLSSRDRGDSSK